VSKETHRFC